LFAALALIVVAPAQAAGRDKVQTFINPDGTGSLFFGYGSAPWVWEACTSEMKKCEPFARGRELQTAEAPAGTVFRVKNAEGETGLSPEWKGRVKQLAPPRVAGVVAANEFVSPVPGPWSGGWQGEDSEMQLAACATEGGAPGECTTLTNPWYERVLGCGESSSFGLDPRFVGQFLRVADRQSGGPHAEAGVGLSSPFGGEVWGRSRNTSVAIVGHIAPATNPPAGDCGPPPSPTATISAKGIAQVECAGGCSVVLVGTRKGRRQLVTDRLGEQDLLRPFAAPEMKLPRTALARLGAGKVRLTVEIDGTRWARRTIRISGS
jgi:hypothetical protein